MSKSIVIYCEGTKGSHDFDILELVTEGLSNIEIQPIGGKSGVGKVIEAYQKLIVKPDFYLLFRDRDFDKPIPATESLIIDRTTYFSYRTTIENYLFNVTSFFQFIATTGLNTTFNLHSEADVIAIFIQAAQDIQFYQAARHTMGKMRIRVDFGTTWTSGSGTLPSDLDSTYCQDEAWNKIYIESQQVQTQWTQSIFDTEYNHFIQVFNQDFFDNLAFLVWFQGKDFGASLTRLLPNFPLKSYYKFAKAHFDYTQFPDLVELRNIIQANL